MDTRPLIVTDDEELLEELLHLGAAAGVDLVRARHPDNRAQWRTARVIVIDATAAGAAVRADWPRRAGVFAVMLAEPDPVVWEHCARLGVEDTLRLPADEALLVEILADAEDTAADGGRSVAVLGARGGAGASVLAAALAVTAARAGAPVILADCDPWGTGQEVLLGVESLPGLRWPDLLASTGRVATDALHRSLPSVPRVRLAARDRGQAGAGTPDTGGRGPRMPGAGGLGRVSVLAQDRARPGPVPAGVVDVVITSCRRAGELVVLDLPRAPSEAGDRAMELADLVVLVASADVGSCSAARGVLDRLRPWGVPLGLVVRGPSPGGLGADDVARALDLPLVSSMRPQPGLARDLELGVPPGLRGTGPLASAAKEVLARIPRGQDRSRGRAR